ncbi:hypothetical protein [Streptomyces sp. NPDC004296]|uniref:hypothetical protein n=1 Tax=Streptomyces sp. NPDC004296 TaxID=3364697 RepID=UPI003684E8ED
MPAFTVSLSISDKKGEKDKKSSLDYLAENDFVLYGFKAVGGAKGGRPLVWFADSQYSTTNNISWVTKYSAYASPYQPEVKVVDKYNQMSIEQGQTFRILKKQCTGEVIGDPDSVKPITVKNAVENTEFNAGIAQQRQDLTEEFRPLCVKELAAGSGLHFTPVEKVLLIFHNQPVTEGAVITQAFSNGLLIDVTGASKRVVSWDKGKGWLWGLDEKGNWTNKPTWATKVTSDEEITPYLLA